jgi:hypothetical protein
MHALSKYLTRHDRKFSSNYVTSRINRLFLFSISRLLFEVQGVSFTIARHRRLNFEFNAGFRLTGRG